MPKVEGSLFFEGGSFTKNADISEIIGQQAMSAATTCIFSLRQIHHEHCGSRVHTTLTVSEIPMYKHSALAVPQM